MHNLHLSYLLKNIFPLPAVADREISGLTLDSREAKANNLFFAIKGTKIDGREYIAKATGNGATAILLDAEGDTANLTWQQKVPCIAIPKLQQNIGLIAARFYDYPAKKLRVIGVTGTCGKTSCTQFIAEVLQTLHFPCAIIGSLGRGFYGALHDVGLNTPDPITLQAYLQQFVKQGAKALTMEVSSHGIQQERVQGIPFELGIFTNLSQDHLDYHGDMQTYAAVKKRFFTELPTQQALINADDAKGREWINELATHKLVYAYSTEGPVPNIPTLYSEQAEFTLQGIRANVNSPWGHGELVLPLIGQFNLSNALAALAALCLCGIPFQEALQSLAHVHPVPGRMQTLGGQDGKPLVVVDHAHKPDALEKVLHALRTHTKGKLICVFGCGGERDRGKRPFMARIAEEIADTVIVTNDNPRHEQPDVIANEIMQGFLHPEHVIMELDRANAIHKAIELASTKDCVLIAGKGVEQYQLIGDIKLPFDDVEKVREYLGTMLPAAH